MSSSLCLTLKQQETEKINYLINQFFILVKLQENSLNIFWFELLKSEDLLLFFIISDSK